MGDQSNQQNLGGYLVWKDHEEVNGGRHLFLGAGSKDQLILEDLEALGWALKNELVVTQKDTTRSTLGWIRYPSASGNLFQFFGLINGGMESL